MGTDESKAIACRIVEEVLNRGNLAVVDELFAPDYLDHSPRPGQWAGAQGYKYSIISLRTAFPDLRHTIDDVIAEDDRVMLFLTARGTHQGEFLGLPPTGKRVTIRGLILLRLAGGKVVERWSLGDDLGLVLQLSAVSPPAAPRAVSQDLLAQRARSAARSIYIQWN